MLKGLLSGLSLRNSFVGIILVSNAFVWYYCADDIILGFSDLMPEGSYLIPLLWATSFAVLIISAFIGAQVSSRIKDKRRFLSVWMLSGVILPFASLFVSPNDFSAAILLPMVFSLSLGIGLPTCMDYFTKSNAVETIGRMGGLVMLFTGVSVVALKILVPVDLFTQALALSLWRSFGFLSFTLLKPSIAVSPESEKYSYKTIIRNRSFILYFIPWTLFTLINYLSSPVLDDLFVGSPPALSLVQNGLIGLSALLGGFLADSVGRKRMAIAGFVSLGLGYAVLGIAPTSDFALYFHTAVDGIGWGILLVIFVTILWGDLSRTTSSEKFYAIGVLPFFVSRFLPMVLKGQITQFIPENSYAVFSFCAFFLFLAVLPLVYAPETLPDKIMKKRELTMYVERAQEIAQKYY